MAGFSRKKLGDIFHFAGKGRSRYMHISKDMDMGDMLDDLTAFADMTLFLKESRDGAGKPKVEKAIIEIEKVDEW